MSNQDHRFVTVVATDFSEPSIRALDEALIMTSLRRGEVHALYVEPDLGADLLPARPLIEALDMDAVLTAVQQRAQARVDAVTSGRGPLQLARVVAHVRHGNAAKQIVDLAAEVDADLVVVGSHGRRGVPRLLLGSVAEAVVRLAHCPVWVVRPKDHALDMKVPAIEPPCPDCVARRKETGNPELWCARHSEHHVRAHTFAYRSDDVYAAESAPYEATPERGA